MEHWWGHKMNKEKPKIDANQDPTVKKVEKDDKHWKRPMRDDEDPEAAKKAIEEAIKKDLM